VADVVREVVIAATPETIWPFLTEPSKYGEWGGAVQDLDPRPGGAYRVLLQSSNPSAGTFIEVVPLEKVVFSFGWDVPGHPIPAGSTIVEITLHPEGDKTRVRLVHRGLPDDAIEDHGRGWAHYTSRLAAVAVGADPGPETIDG